MHTWFTNLFIRNLLFLLLLQGILLGFADFSLMGSDNSAFLKSLFSNISFLQFYIHSFFFNHFIVRLLLFRRRYRLFVLLAVLYLLLTFASIYGLFALLGNRDSYLSAFVNALLALVCGSGIYFMFHWLRDNVLQTAERLRQKEEELQLLHRQLHPHFLMNALNNLYGVSLAEPALISEKILELAELLRYQTTATQRSQVVLSDEINFLQRYLDYQRYKSSGLTIESTRIGDPGQLMIAPLLFLPLLENALKFALESPERTIRLQLVIKDNTVEIGISNSCLPPGQRSTGTQIGLANLRKRLLLLDSRNRLSLQPTDPTHYSTSLHVWLS